MEGNKGAVESGKKGKLAKISRVLRHNGTLDTNVQTPSMDSSPLSPPAFQGNV